MMGNMRKFRIDHSKKHVVNIDSYEEEIEQSNYGIGSQVTKVADNEKIQAIQEGKKVRSNVYFSKV